MTKVLLTGGSGFIAAHVLDALLAAGHSVTTTVRTQAKADAISSAHPNSSIGFKIVPDISVPNAFDDAVKIPGLEAVVHTASPFHFNITDVKKDLLDPAINGTVGILEAIKKNAPGVKRVVITSSFASILDASKGSYPGHVYSEKDWNPITEAQATESPAFGYRASKTFAERAAWEFVEKEKPGFSIATICPPMVFGPIVHNLSNLESLNTSNQRILAMLQGKFKDGLPDSGVYLWTDVRDLAVAHVRAMEVPAAGGKRFFVTEGHFSNREICEVIRKNFPEYAAGLPGPGGEGDYPTGKKGEGLYGFDNSRVREVLGVKFRGLEECVVDLVKSLKAEGA